MNDERKQELVIENAIIEQADIFVESSGVLTLRLKLRSNAGISGFGGYGLYAESRSTGDVTAGKFFTRLLNIANAESWRQLVGKAIRIKRSDEYVFEIGHIVKEDWFCPDAECSFAGNGEGEENAH